jgi:NAD+ synthase (glutamine-hydrolysing)
MAKQFLIGVAQARLSANLGKNLREIAEYLDQARAEKLDLLVFPECAMTGYGPAYYSSRDFDPDAVEAALVEVRGMVKASGTAVLVGAHLPRGTDWTNSLLCIRPDGRVAARYDKAHLYDRDPDYYAAGDAPGPVVSVKRARIGLQICFDVRFPEPFRRLALNGAQVLAIPSFIHGAKDMWKGPVIEAHVRSRAAENGRFVLFANAAGAQQNAPSMIADPRGELIAKARRGAEELLIASLDLSRVNDNYLALRREALYAPVQSKRSGKARKKR